MRYTHYFVIMRNPHYSNLQLMYHLVQVVAMKLRKNDLGDKNVIGLKIISIRKKRKIKQKDFLAKLHVQGLEISPTMLSRIEGQHRLVHDYEVVEIAKALGVTPNDLLMDEPKAL